MTQGLWVSIPLSHWVPNQTPHCSSRNKRPISWTSHLSNQTCQDLTLQDIHTWRLRRSPHKLSLSTTLRRDRHRCFSSWLTGMDYSMKCTKTEGLELPQNKNIKKLTPLHRHHNRPNSTFFHSFGAELHADNAPTLHQRYITTLLAQ